MKPIITASAIAALFAWALLGTADNSTPAAPLSSEEISWIEFCKARHYNVSTDDPATIDEYLDTWVGSVEEEKAFNHLPAQEA